MTFLNYHKKQYYKKGFTVVRNIFSNKEKKIINTFTKRKIINLIQYIIYNNFIKKV